MLQVSEHFKCFQPPHCGKAITDIVVNIEETGKHLNTIHIWKSIYLLNKLPKISEQAMLRNGSMITKTLNIQID